MNVQPGGLDAGPALAFLRLLWTLDHALQRQSKAMRARLGVTGPQRLALRIITQVPGISSSGLAEVLQLHPSTLTGVLARLEARRLIVRRVNRHDRREGLLRVTPSGRALGRQMRGSIELAVDRVLRAARPGHVAAARRLLGSLVDEIERMP